MQSPAVDLREVLACFKPYQPLDGETLVSFYYDRDRDTRQRMGEWLLDAASADEPPWVLYTGNPGSGKSTELNKLCQELSESSTVIRVWMSRLQPPVRLHDDDLLYLIAASLDIAIAERPPANSDDPSSVPTPWARRALAYFSDHQFAALRILEAPPGASRMITVEFDARYRNMSAEQPRSVSRWGLPRLDLIDAIQEMSKTVLARTGRPPLLVLDDTDKLDLESAERLFLHHAETLSAIRAPAIYTVPSALWYRANRGARGESQAGMFRLPDFRLYTPAGEPDLRHRQALDDIIARRMNPALISHEAHTQIIECSGGTVRRLIELVHFAAVNAIDRGVARIELRDADRASAWFHRY